MEGRTNTEMHGSDAAAAGRTWAPPAMVTEFDVNARLTFTAIKAHEYVHGEECVVAHPGLVRCCVLLDARCTLHLLEERCTRHHVCCAPHSALHS
jgi:hypothetical protein